MQKRSALDSPRLSEIRRKRHKAFRNKVLFFVGLFIILLAGVSFALHIKKINISNIEVSGNKVVETDDITRIIQNKINGNYLWIFPKTNFLIYPKNDIKKSLATDLKRLNGISISISNFKTLIVKVTEHEGEYLWCGASLTTYNDINNKCYFVDSSGYIFDEAPYFSGEIYFKFFGNDFNLKIKDNNPTGSYFLQKNFANLINFKKNLEEMGIKTHSFYLDENNDGNIYISKNMDGAKIIFKIDSDYQKLIENLQSIIKTEPLKSDIKNKLNNLKYIDLRFGNKVYYKFQ